MLSASVKRISILKQLKNTMSTGNKGPIESSIFGKLKDKFTPTYLDVFNESGMHNVPKGSETHFKVVIVSDSFAKLPLIKRHRSVNSVLQDELSSGVHALSITAKTPEEWAKSPKMHQSPPCKGGAGL